MSIKRVGEFEKGILWNYMAVMLMALNGFICNFIIAYFYDASAVGLYNRIYSYYLVLSQVSVFGIHMSVIQNISKLVDNPKERERSLSSSLVVTIIISSITSIGIKIFLVNSQNIIDISTRKAMENIILALILFSINKVILSYYNGMSLMKEHAMLQSVRYILLGGSIFVLSWLNTEPEKLALCFLISELGVLILEIVLILLGRMRLGKITQGFIKTHLKFGKKIFLSNIVLDLNTKVDIISLGILLNNDYYVGIYSFAVMFIEGFYQILVVIRKSLNPKITQYYYGLEKSISLFERAEKITRLLAWFFYVGIVIGYILVCLVVGKEEYFQGIVIIMIIGLSIAVTSKYILYGNIFSQIGDPQKETYINLYTVMINVFTNICLIPKFDIVGAAIATAISYIAFAIMIRKYGRKREKLCMFFSK